MVLGSSIGIVGFFGGITGILPAAAVGAGVCYAGVKFFKYKIRMIWLYKRNNNWRL